jgi:hypothetical protein
LEIKGEIIMRLPIILTTTLLAAYSLIGQEKTEPAGPLEAAVIPVKTLSGDSFNRLAKLLGAFGVKFTADDKLRTIVVYAPKEVVAEMRRVVAQLDQPGSDAAVGKNIEMTLAFLRCSTKGQPDASSLPADLEPAAKQLRAATQYKDIRLWDVVPLHIQEGKETRHSFRLPGAVSSVPSNIPHGGSSAQLVISPEAVTRKDTGRYVRFDRLNINFRIPYVVGGSFQAGVSGQGVTPMVSTQIQYMEVGLNTSGDFKEGQKTVLGKISGLDDDTALFVVISLKVLD